MKKEEADYIKIMSDCTPVSYTHLIYRYEFDAQNVQTALDAGLVDETTTPEDRFRPDDGLTCGELAEFMVRSLQPEGKRGLDMQTLSLIHIYGRAQKSA